jgi:excisionase family DNA binding protein
VFLVKPLSSILPEDNHLIMAKESQTARKLEVLAKYYLTKSLPCLVHYNLTNQIGCQLLTGERAMEKLSVKEAMEKLHVSETTIRRMIKRGDLPNAYKEDRKIVIPQSDIDAYLQHYQQPSGQVETRVKPETSEQLEASFVPTPSQSPEPPVAVDADVADRATEAAVIEESPEIAPAPELESQQEPRPEPEPKSVVEPEDAPPVKTEPAKVSPSAIAQPIEELDESPESSESKPIEAPPEPAYTSKSVPASQENEQSLKWVLVQAGILGATWLEEIFRSMRTALEKYKKEAFPGSSDNKE